MMKIYIGMLIVALFFEVSPSFAQSPCNSSTSSNFIAGLNYGTQGIPPIIGSGVVKSYAYHPQTGFHIIAGDFGPGPLHVGSLATNTSSQGSSDVFLHMISNNGLSFVLTLGGAGNERLKDVVVGPNGELVIVGTTDASTFNACPLYFGFPLCTDIKTTNNFQSTFITRIDYSNGGFVYSGTQIFNESVGLLSVDVVKVNTLGNIVVGGYFFGNVGLTSNVTITSFGSKDALIATFDPAFNLVQSQTFSSNGDDDIRDVALDAFNNIHFAGSFNGDILEGFMDPWGGSLQQNVIGSPTASEYASSIIVQGQDVYLYGRFEDPNIDFDPGPGSLFLTNVGSSVAPTAFLLKMDIAHNRIWGRVFGVSFAAVGNVLDTAKATSDNCGDIYLTGNWIGNLELDPSLSSTLNTVVTAYGHRDTFINRLTSAGTWVNAIRTSGPASMRVVNIQPFIGGGVLSMGAFTNGTIYTQKIFATGTVSPTTTGLTTPGLSTPWGGFDEGYLMFFN